MPPTHTRARRQEPAGPTTWLFRAGRAQKWPRFGDEDEWQG